MRVETLISEQIKFSESGVLRMISAHTNIPWKTGPAVLVR
jgi:hypothetical protein